MTRTSLSAGCAGLLFALGCSDGKLDLAASAADTGGYAGDSADSRNLRIDVYPSSWSHPGLLPQTFNFTGDNWTGLDLGMTDSETVEGLLTGFDVTQAASVSVPGLSDQPIAGRFMARLADTVSEYSTETEDGQLSATVLPAEGYDLAWIPAPELLLPFAVARGEALRSSLNISVDLEFGVPIYGIVLDEGGQPLPGILVRAIEAETGFAGEPTTTDDMGSYQLRVFPGSYVLETSGDASKYYLPTVTIPIEVGDDGLNQPLQYIATDAHNVTGQVFDIQGQPARNVRVRFTARELQEHSQASLRVDSETDANGRYTVRVVSGSYEIEYIPDYEGDTGPLDSSQLLTVDDDLELGAVELPTRPVIQGRVLIEDGTPVSDALIQAQEIGFDSFVYAAQSDSAGNFTLPVSQTELRWTVTPPPQGYEEWAVTLTETDPAEIQADAVAFTLVRGEQIQGCVQFNGEALTFTPLDLRDGSGTLYITATTDDSGCFDVRLDTEAWRSAAEAGSTSGTSGTSTAGGGSTSSGTTGADTTGADTAGADTAGADTAGADTGHGHKPRQSPVL